MYDVCSEKCKCFSVDNYSQMHSVCPCMNSHLLYSYDTVSNKCPCKYSVDSLPSNCSSLCCSLDCCSMFKEQVSPKSAFVSPRDESGMPKAHVSRPNCIRNAKGPRVAAQRGEATNTSLSGPTWDNGHVGSAFIADSMTHRWTLGHETSMALTDHVSEDLLLRQEPNINPLDQSSSQLQSRSSVWNSSTNLEFSQYCYSFNSHDIISLRGNVNDSSLQTANAYVFTSVHSHLPC